MNNIFTSCDFLRNHIMFKRNGIAFCCNAKHDTFIPLEYWKKPLDADYIIDYRKKVEDSLAAGEPCMCTGCHLLETKAWKRSKYIARQVSFEGTNGCNFRCVYCIYDKNIVAMDNAVEGWIHLVNDMVSRNLIDPNGIILYADGEPLIMKNISHLFEFIHRNTNLRMDIRSNLSVLPNSFVDFFRTGRITLVTSLDCGTRNTFRVIKNNDCFDKVVDHIFCCADANPENLYLKYICIPENISQEDMNGFVEIAERANCRQVIISFDYLKTISDDIYAFAAKLAAQCHRKGVDARFEYFLAEQRCGDQYPKQRIGLHYRNAFSNPFTDFHALARPSSGEIGICHFGPDAPDDLAIHVWCHDPLSSRNAKAVVAFWKDTLLYSGKPNLSMQGGPLRGGGGGQKNGVRILPIDHDMNDFILREPDALKIFCQFGEDKWRYFMPNLSQENNAASMLLIAPVLDEAASEHVKSDARTIIPIRKENLNSAILMADRRDALDLIPKNGVVAEIGVAYGGFSEKILEVLNPNVFYAVDRYNVTPGYEVWGLTILKDSGKTHYDWYVDKFRIPIEEGRMVVKQGDSWDVIQTFNDRSLDYVYLDAGHDYESVKRDLSALTGKIKIGGYLQVNDYTSTSYLDDLEYGVFKAVNEFLSESSHQVKALCLHNYGYHDLLIEIHQ